MINFEQLQALFASYDTLKTQCRNQMSLLSLKFKQIKMKILK